VVGPRCKTGHRWQDLRSSSSRGLNRTIAEGSFNSCQGLHQARPPHSFVHANRMHRWSIKTRWQHIPNDNVFKGSPGFLARFFISERVFFVEQVSLIRRWIGRRICHHNFDFSIQRVVAIPITAKVGDFVSQPLMSECIKGDQKPAVVKGSQRRAIRFCKSHVIG